MNNKETIMKPFIAILTGLLLAAQTTLHAADARPQKPDVLFIVVDDMNDWTTLFNKDNPIKTPNLERLAQRGMLFTRAYCLSAACNPSRAGTLTGLRPTTTGVYENSSDWRLAMPERKTIMQQFMTAGYEVRGAGKIFHHQLDRAFHDIPSFHDFQHMRPEKYPPNKLNGARNIGTRNADWGEWPPDPADSIDCKTANYCIAELSKPAGPKPLFLACGIFRPHSPFYAPSEYHEPYRNLGLPIRKADDWDDLPTGSATLMAKGNNFRKAMTRLEQQKPGSCQSFIRSYAACSSFADDQIGRVLKALDDSPRRDNTIVVIWSDHGFHLGEKDHFEKFAMWEKANHIPFFVVAPGVTRPASRCGRPVDMSVLYPTLLELCNLPAEPECDGTSIVPLLRNPDAAWDRPALMTFGRGNHAVRSERWRYIRYADGTEELCDHDKDPDEWTNLAADAAHQAVVLEHRAWLPTTEATAVRDLKLK